MKKLIFSAALLSGLVFAACSDDSDESYSNCQTCITELSQFQVCTGENGNVYSQGQDTGLTMIEFMAEYCTNSLPDLDPDPDPDPDPTENCVTCAAFEVGGQTSPAVEVCESETGTAIINDMDTGQPFDDYIEALEMMTTCE